MVGIVPAMASMLLQLASWVPAGTTVEIRKRSDWSNPVGPPDGAPAGAAAATTVATTTGAVTVTGLDTGASYRCWAPALSKLGPRFTVRDTDPPPWADDPAADGYIKAGVGPSGEPTYQKLLERVPAATYGDPDLLVAAPLNNLFSASGVVGAVNRLNLVRAITPKAGVLKSLYICVQAVAASGTFEGAVFDGNGGRKWTQGAVAATGLAVGWNKIGDPNIDVDAGEPLFLGWLNPENTLSCYRYPIGNALGTDLPFDLVPDGNGKLVAYLPGQTVMPAFADPNSYIASTLVWAIAGVIV